MDGWMASDIYEHNYMYSNTLAIGRKGGGGFSCYIFFICFFCAVYFLCLFFLR